MGNLSRDRAISAFRWLLICAKRNSSQRSGYAAARGDCVKKTRKRHAVGEMKDGPSESPCRRRLQTAMSCSGTMAGVVNVMVKRRGLTASCKDERDERKRISG